MHVTLQQLMYFVAVANVRSFTRAADQVGVAQPTLSRALRALEDELGSPLINRGSAVTLTPAGEAELWRFALGAASPPDREVAPPATSKSRERLLTRLRAGSGGEGNSHKMQLLNRKRVSNEESTFY